MRLIISVALPSIIFKFGKIEPTQRGFFCNDESIRYPYRPGTISTTALILVGGLANIITVSQTSSGACNPEYVAFFTKVKLHPLITEYGGYLVIRLSGGGGSSGKPNNSWVRGEFIV